MQAILVRYAPYAFALFRIVAGLMFTMHGTQKLFGIPGGKPGVPIGSMLGLAGVIELICGVLILVGLFGSIAALIASGERWRIFWHTFRQAFGRSSTRENSPCSTALRFSSSPRKDPASGASTTWWPDPPFGVKTGPTSAEQPEACTLLWAQIRVVTGSPANRGEIGVSDKRVERMIFRDLQPVREKHLF